MHFFISLLRKLKISNRLMFGYLTLFLLVLNSANLTHYITVKDLLQNKIEQELQFTTNSIANSIRTTANTTIRNYLRAITESNLLYIEQQFKLVEKGDLSTQEAKERVEHSLIYQRIGDSGYPYIVDSKGVIKIHPKRSLINTSLMVYSFMREQTTQKTGYLEYDWKNPGETKERPKALHMLYFEPWDWIISSSSYRSEFLEIINIDDFQRYISDQRIGNTGYIFVIDSKGEVVLHPFLDGNFFHVEDSNGYRFIQDILRKKNGSITYTWRNPGEESFREKLAVFQYIPDFDWYVVSSTYSEELYRSIDDLSHIYLVILMVSVVILIPSNLLLSHSIVTPLKQVMDKMQTAATGRYDTRIVEVPGCHDELNSLSGYFNCFMRELEKSNQELHKQIEEKIVAQQQQIDLNIQLEELNQTLEKKVIERTYDLEASMAELQETQQQLIESEKLAALGGLVAGVAHEVNTPLGISVTATSLVREIINELANAFSEQTLTSEQFSSLMLRLNESTQMLENNLKRASRLICDFKQTAVDQVSESQSEFSVYQTLQALIGSLHSETQKVPVAVVLNIDQAIVMNSLPGVLSQVVSNLVLNSVNHAFPTAHRERDRESDFIAEITVEIQQDDEEIILTYRDNGIGVSDHLHQKIFEPFYTTKRGNGGSGLGLNLVYNLVKQKLKGKLEFSSQVNYGVEFRLVLPKNLAPFSE